MNDVEERREAIDIVQFARQGGGEIEAEAVDVHLGDPVAQAVHDELEHLRVADIEAVARCRCSPCNSADLRDQPIVSGVIDAAEVEHRSEVIAFGGVVVDHVEDDLDAFAMQGLHHGLELGDLAAGIARWRSTAHPG